MNRSAALIAAVFLGLATLAVSQTTPEPELRPSQKIMRARAAWMKAMTQNLADKKYAEVAKDAGELSAQAGTVAAGASGEPKELHQRVSDLSASLALAAGKMDDAGAAARMADIKATCTECHTKYRKTP